MAAELGLKKYTSLQTIKSSLNNRTLRLDPPFFFGTPCSFVARMKIYKVKSIRQDHEFKTYPPVTPFFGVTPVCRRSCGVSTIVAFTAVYKKSIWDYTLQTLR